MKNTLHTDGPWAIHTCNENGPSLDSFYLSTTAQTWDGNEEERIICRFPTGTGQFFDMGRENLANARIISAAPDLLSALESLAVWNDGEPCFCHVHGESDRARYTPHDSYCDKARAALRKAKGEA
jgi:hypothetical protein